MHFEVIHQVNLNGDVLLVIWSSDLLGLKYQSLSLRGTVVGMSFPRKGNAEPIVNGSSVLRDSIPT